MADLTFSGKIGSIPISIMVGDKDASPEITIFAVGMTVAEVIDLLEILGDQDIPATERPRPHRNQEWLPRFDYEWSGDER